MIDLGVSFSQNENFFLLAAPVVVVALIVRSARVRQRARIILGFLPGDTDFEAPVNRGVKNFLFVTGLFFACVAALGPQWGQKMHPIKAQGLDICFALDLSRSMMTEDVSPSRLGQAKNQLEIFLPSLGGDRAALVGFAGSAYVAAPLSVDYNAVATFLEPMSPETVSDQATNLSVGVEACLTALGLDAVKDRNQILDDAARLVVLISDGEDTENDDTGSVARAERLGVPVFSMAMGTAKGGPIPVRDNGKLIEYLKDPATNQPAISKLEIDGLKAISSKTGGKVFYASAGVEAWKGFESAISDYKRASRDAGTRLDKEERFQWPLLLAFICLLLDFLLTETKWRWRLSVGLVFLLPFFAPRPARADTSGNPGVVWWNNKGESAFKAKDYKQADEDFMGALAKDASDLQAQYNWATNKLHSAGNPEDKEHFDGKAADEALSQLDKLRQDPRVAAADMATFRRKLDYQIAESLEAKGDNAKALDNYYKSLGETSGPPAPGSPDAELVKKAKANVSRLLVAPPSSQQNQSSGGGQGQQDQKQDKGKDKDKDKGKQDQPQQFSQDHQKPKFSGTDVNEQQAKKIMESVSGEEKEVLKRKSRQEAKEDANKRARSSKDHGDTSHAKPW